MLKRIIIARHGLSIGDEDNKVLNDKGREQMRRLASVIKRIATVRLAAVYSSAALWVIQSAEILAGELYARNQVFPALSNGDSQQVIELISSLQAQDIETVILTTHEKLTARFTHTLSVHLFEKKLLFPAAWPGEAYLLNLEKATTLFVSACWLDKMPYTQEVGNRDWLNSAPKTRIEI
jgi:phosphohistidine phosphatase SixA